jgi:DNA primase
MAMTPLRSEHRAQALNALARDVATVPHRTISSPFDEPAPRDAGPKGRGAGRLDDDLIAQVRDAADIATIVGESVELHQTGSDYRGACPLHGGTHRNFSVIPRKQMFYCFVCHEGGDVFAFYMKRFGMDFPTAVREVAKKVGITIPDRPNGGPDPREPLYSAVAVAADWYARYLRDADDAGAARHYLEGRGFELTQLLPHGLGFAPRGDEFVSAMHRLGIEIETLVAAGLAVTRDDGSVRPRFWNRLVFPIYDLRGRVVGFGGRVLGDQKPRYLNSPATDVFHKGELLYDLHGARHAIRGAEHAVLAEGYFDVLRLMLAGVDHVVAPLGTSLTAEQAQLLRRVTARVTIAFDGDKRGLRATFRAAKALLRAGVQVTVAAMPAGEDPDTLVRKAGVAAVEQALRDAVDVLEREIQLLEQKGWLGTLDGRRRALDRLLPTLRAASDSVTRDLYVSRTAEALDITRESVMGKVAARNGRGVRPASRDDQGSAAVTNGPKADAVHAVEPTDPDELARVAMREGA